MRFLRLSPRRLETLKTRHRSQHSVGEGVDPVPNSDDLVDFLSRGVDGTESLLQGVQMGVLLLLNARI